MTTNHPTQWREKFGGQMSEAEALFCKNVRELARAVLDSLISFGAAMSKLLIDLRELRKFGLDVDAAMASGFRPSISTIGRSRNRLQQTTYFQCQQARAIDQGRVTGRAIGRLLRADFHRIERALWTSLGLP